MCIYYITRTDLTYSSGEHIISAGLGGIKKLPKEFVSKEFNNDISKLEGEMMQDSFFSVPRQFEGPGKRGSIAEQHATKSKVIVFKNLINDTFTLGYRKLGNTYEIPNIELNISTGLMSIRMVETDMILTQEVMSQIRTQCQNAESLRIKSVTDNQLPDNIILISFEKNIEKNYDGYIFKNSTNVSNVNSEVLNLISSSSIFNQIQPISEQRKLQSTQDFSFKDDYLRVYAKIAFNYFASLSNLDIVKQARFNSIRNYIATGSISGLAYFDFQSKDAFQIPNVVLPDRCHTILIFKHGSQLYSRVAIYSLPAVILLTDDFPELMQNQGLICDFKNRIEYTADEYVKKYGTNA